MGKACREKESGQEDNVRMLAHFVGYHKSFYTPLQVSPEAN